MHSQSAIVRTFASFILLVIPITLLSQKQVKFSLNTGYTLNPDGYYTPQTLQKSSKPSPLNYSNYELTSSFSPNLEITLEIPLDKKSSVNFSGRYTYYFMEYKIQDKAPQFYSPYGHLKIQNNAFQFSSLYETKLDYMNKRNQHIKVGGGVVVQTIQETENDTKEGIEDILKEFPLSSNYLENFSLGLRLKASYNIRYSKTNRGQFMHFSVFGDLMSSGMYTAKTMLSSGISIGIDLN